MSEYLVHISIALPESFSEPQVAALQSQEAQRAADLFDAGSLVRLWRVPGQRANWGIWRADDATELHGLLTSLPMWPWMKIEVHPLAQHPSDRSGTSFDGERG